ncbi:spermidine/putrescine ABC transporter substrate-binding protein [Methylacidiphilum caldifontis]|uniref:spermidine/putrescine ABC transporter substrate-binding protein n=1 Tax=Methylacidiphilum caldifontis TaxID=2795386 RepID=UPI001A8EE79A|nr:spermidine/putrescine ABC transporter substrate-binding protein [Methylacidiphilum caldifontis]QSR89502.1 spermidine/putrescine ABC transporter substrate-binding protein [Methylacidiphilum caldifontis]
MSLHLLVPEGHLPEALISEYHTRSGEQLSAVFYTDEQRAVEDINHQDFDLIAITDRMAYLLIKQNLLSPLPIEIKRLGLLDHKFLFHYYDPTNTYCWPYGWTLLGISWLHNPTLKNYPTRWIDLLSANYKIDYPPNDLLKTLIFQSLFHGSQAQASSFVNRPAVSFSVYIDTVSELLKRNEKEKNRLVILPKDYSWITLFHWAIPQKSHELEKIKTALLFLCTPQQQASILSCNWLGAVTAEAYMKTAEIQRKSSLIYPPATYLNLCRFFRMDHYLHKSDFQGL